MHAAVEDTVFAKTGEEIRTFFPVLRFWVPAFAGMTSFFGICAALVLV